MQLTPIFQVSEAIEILNNHLELLGVITIEGEISRIDIKNGRLIFATIKDSQGALDVFSLTHMVTNHFQLEEGMKVQVIGTPGLYKNSGRFRMFAQKISLVGEGSLQIAFEKLKAKLQAEGLFDQSHKRSLPEWPVNIGLITAQGSSAYHDMVKILSARMSGLHIKTIPVNVQGQLAIPTILKALSYTNQHAKAFDLLILGRGGGSLEDLAAFNDESVARAVFGSIVPIISAVGHEDNWSLTDYVADVRASTPSNAAELAVKDKNAVIQEIDANIQYIHQKTKAYITANQQFLDRQLQSIYKNMKQNINSFNQTIESLDRNLQQYHQRLKITSTAIGTSLIYIQKNLTTKHQLATQNVTSLHRLLQSLDYKNTLKRGFSITKDEVGHILTDKNQIKSGDTITTQFSTSEINSTVN